MALQRVALFQFPSIADETSFVDNSNLGVVRRMCTCMSVGINIGNKINF